MVILKDRNHGRAISGAGGVDVARGEDERGKEMDEPEEEECQKRGRKVRECFPHEESVLRLALFRQRVSQDRR